jgi:hypothetical protein
LAGRTKRTGHGDGQTLRQAVNADVEKTPHHGPNAENENRQNPGIHQTSTLLQKMFSTLPI